MKMKRWFLLNFGLVLGVLALFGPVAQAQSGQAYIVQHDDTLWEIAAKYLGDGNLYPEIIAATQAMRQQDASFASLDNPNLILAGSKLWIPASGDDRQSPILQADTPSPAGAAPLPDSSLGHIAFSFWNNAPNRCTYEINIIDVSACLAGEDSCQATRRIFALNNVSEPALSADGQTLAFRGWGEIPEKYNEERLDHPYFGCSIHEAERQLGVSNLDATAYRRGQGFFEDAHPDWSPDGQRLLFDTARNGDGISRIMSGVMGPAGLQSEVLRLIGQQPSWAPDSDRFVYRGCDISGNRCGLWLARAQPVEAWDLGKNMIGPLLEEPAAAHPDWSPVDENIVYQSPAAGNWDLYLIDSAGGPARQLTNSPDIEGLPSWSPDGTRIAYLSNAGGQWAIWMMRADGSQQQPIFTFDGGTFTPGVVPPYFVRDWIDEQISWAR